MGISHSCFELNMELTFLSIKLQPIKKDSNLKLMYSKNLKFDISGYKRSTAVQNSCVVTFRSNYVMACHDILVKTKIT